MSVILIVDDEKNIRLGLKRALEPSGYKVVVAKDGEEGLEEFMTRHIDLAIVDIRLPKLSGLELLKKINETNDAPPVIFITGHGTVETAVEAMHLGAYDFLIKPINLNKLEALIHRALEYKTLTETNKSLTIRVQEFEIEKLLLGKSNALKDIINKIKIAAPSKSSIYIYGESGTGKELVCDAIHKLSHPEAPLVKVNCAALSPTIIESELFGHEKGAFTGADRQKEGRFEAADGGTLFLDEVSEIPPEIQVKLLRVLQEGTVERVGSHEPINIDIRLVAASNKNLAEEIKKGNFREDLYYRINVIDFHLPALRDRKGDIEYLAHYFFTFFAQQNHYEDLKVSGAVYTAFNSYHWPGNIRELRNLTEKLVVLSRGEKIRLPDLPPYIKNQSHLTESIKVPIGTTMKDAEKMIIYETIKYCGGNKSQAADLLKIGRKTLHRKIHESKENF